MNQCYESQVRDKLKVPTVMAKEFMEEVLNEMRPVRQPDGSFIAGKGTFDAFQSVADRARIQPETLAKVITADTKLFSLNKSAFQKQNVSRGVKLVAKQMAESGAREPGMF